MKHRTRTTIFALVFSVALLAVYIFAPSQMEARRITPLVTESAPLSPEEAQARVEAAQQATLAQRTEIARNLGLTSPELLPLSPTFYVSETGYHISQRAGFLSFWRENGGAMVFGYPLSEEIIENGRIVQYFERARFEYHPDAEPGYRVQLSLLGRELTAGRDFPEGNPEDGTMYFPETKHTLSGKFLQFWLKRGGLPIFGYPISEAFVERGEDGNEYVVQYFERHRLEQHPENAPPYNILLSRVGINMLEMNGRDWFTFPKGQPQSGCQYFEATGHSLCEPFLSYWRSHGLEFDGRAGKSEAESLALFGQPLSEPQIEISSNGMPYVTQWFERARFEDHGPDGVLLGLLGNEFAALRGLR